MPAGVWVDLVKPAKRRKGKWMRVDWEGESVQHAAEAARNIRDGRVKLPPGKFSAQSRTIDGQHFVFVRYDGPDE